MPLSPQIRSWDQILFYPGRYSHPGGFDEILKDRTVPKKDLSYPSRAGLRGPFLLNNLPVQWTIWSSYPFQGFKFHVSRLQDYCNQVLRKLMVRDYLGLYHKEPVPKAELKWDIVYFHNGKTRVVFNASMPAQNGQFFNSCMFTGAKLQQDIVKVLCRWRCYQFVFSCDIVKMFRQIFLEQRNRDWCK